MNQNRFSPVTRKHVFWVFNQIRQNPATHTPARLMPEISAIETRYQAANSECADKPAELATPLLFAYFLRTWLLLCLEKWPSRFD